MSLIDYVKADRRMSVDHWRFRLLYWCFNVAPGTPPDRSGLPMFMFRHYCPLFHLTNLIAVLSPLIFALRIIFACSWFAGKTLHAAWSVVEWSWFGVLFNW